MKRQKITIYVNEIISHKIILELDEDEMNSLEDDLLGRLGNDIAGDMTSHSTIQDGEYEVDYYDITDIENNYGENI